MPKDAGSGGTAGNAEPPDGFPGGTQSANQAAVSWGPAELIALPGDGSALLIWSGVEGADSYTVFRARPGSDTEVVIGDVTSQRFSDSGLTNGQRYSYSVAATISGNLSERSPDSGVVPTADQPAARVAEVAQQPNLFRSAGYTPTPLPRLRDMRLPELVLPDYPLWEELYQKAWELLFEHIEAPTAESGFVSNYVDAAFSDNIFQWDTIFILQFAKYLSPGFDAIGSLSNFYAKQHDDGYICRELRKADGDDVYFSGIANSVNPPLFSWTEVRNANHTGQSARLAEVFPVLVAHYLWLREHRCRPDASCWNTRLGSGLDDLTRGNKQPYAWVDMTSQQALNALSLGEMAVRFEDWRSAAYFRQEYVDAVEWLDTRHWDEASEFYYDNAEGSGTEGMKKTVLGYWPLLAAVPDMDRARQLTAHLTDPNEFWRTNVVPVLAADEPGYSAQGQYWNGAVWAPTNYMVIKALQQGGEDALASRLSKRYLNSMADVYQTTGTIWENYSPDLHQGNKKRDFVGWSGVGPVALLLENILGVRIHKNTVRWRVRLPEQHGIRQLAVGDARVNLHAGPHEDGQRKLTMSATKPVTVHVDTGSKYLSLQLNTEPVEHALESSTDW